MYSNAFSNIVTLGLLAAPVLAFPTERVAEVTSLEKRTNWHCTYPETYTITNQTAVYATPELISGVLVQGPGTIASGYTYSKGYTYTAGISASWTIAKVFTAGVTASFGVATTSGTSVTASVACPDNVTCGLTASPLMLKIQGKQTYELCGSGLSYDKTFPCEYAAPDWCPTTTFNTTVGEGFDYTAWIPLAADHSTVNGQDLKAVAYAACTVDGTAPGLDACPGTIPSPN